MYTPNELKTMAALEGFKQSSPLEKLVYFERIVHKSTLREIGILIGASYQTASRLCKAVEDRILLRFEILSKKYKV